MQEFGPMVLYCLSFIKANGNRNSKVAILDIHRRKGHTFNPRKEDWEIDECLLVQCHVGYMKLIKY